MKPSAVYASASVESYARFEILDRTVAGRGTALRPEESSAQVEIVRLCVGGAAGRRTDGGRVQCRGRRRAAQPRRERADDRGCKRILHREDIGATAFEGIAPEQLSGARTRELRG
jgi:hypothetical protein